MRISDWSSDVCSSDLWKLLSGQFDLAFVLVYMFPLFIFAISFNMLSVERDQGTLRMLLSQPLKLPHLVLAKTLVRAGFIIGLAVLVPMLALLITRYSVLDGAADRKSTRLNSSH